MSKVLTFLRYAVLTIVALYGASCTAMFFLWGDMAVSCYEDSEAVAYARSLPKERLAKLYYDLEKASLDPALGYFDEIWAGSKGEFPEPFSDIKAFGIRPKRESIMLNGCFDHYVIFDFHGFESNKKYHPKRQIILSWGEHDSAGSEVIWSQ